jgi:glycosyltransferase involved in cell wall biosynthesis
MNQLDCQISIVLTVHKNRRNYIDRAISSVLSCNLKNIQFEIIVASDYEDEYLKSIDQRPNVRIILCQEQLGVKIISSIEKANYDIIVFLEDDDIFLPEKLERVCYIFKEVSDIGYYHNKSMPSVSNFEELKIKAVDMDDIAIFSSGEFKRLNRNNPDYNMSSIAISKTFGNSILEKVTNRSDLLSISPDTFIFLCAVSEGVKVAIDNISLTQVEHQDSLSYVSPNRSFEDYVSLSVANLYKFKNEYAKFLDFFTTGIANKLIHFKLLKTEITLSILEGKKKRVKFSDLMRYLLYNAVFFPYGDSIKHIVYLTFLSLLPLSISAPLYRRRYFNYVKSRFV